MIMRLIALSIVFGFGLVAFSNGSVSRSAVRLPDATPQPASSPVAVPAIPTRTPLPPSPCTSTLEPGTDILQAAINITMTGEALCLAPGVHQVSSGILSARDGITIRGLFGPNGERAVVRGWAEDDGRVIQIDHDGLTLQDFDITRGDKLLWLDTASDNLVVGMHLYKGGGECLRIKHLSSRNVISYNTITDCGVFSYGVDGSKNGEGIYIGTAPEQRDNNTCNCADSSNNNLIEYNVITTNANEAVDIKEDAEYNIVRGNLGYNQLDSQSAVFDSRGDHNAFLANVAVNAVGAGFRTGGDTVDGRVYGKNNVFRDNFVTSADHSGYKFMVGPQDVDCSNTAIDVPMVFYFDEDEFDISGTCDANLDEEDDDE